MTLVSSYWWILDQRLDKQRSRPEILIRNILALCQNFFPRSPISNPKNYFVRLSSAKAKSGPKNESDSSASIIAPLSCLIPVRFLFRRRHAQYICFETCTSAPLTHNPLCLRYSYAKYKSALNPNPSHLHGSLSCSHLFIFIFIACMV